MDVSLLFFAYTSLTVLVFQFNVDAILPHHINMLSQDSRCLPSEDDHHVSGLVSGLIHIQKQMIPSRPPSITNTAEYYHISDLELH